MKLPNSKIYWADYLSYSAMLTDTEVCEVMKLVAMRAMSYENPSDNLSDNRQDNLSDNPSVYKQKQIQKQILKLNPIQIDFYNCLSKAQDESARDYISKITNGRKGGRPKKANDKQLDSNSITSAKQKDNIVSIDDLKDNAIKKTSAYQALQMWKGVGSSLKDTVTIDDNFNIFELDHPQIGQMRELYGDGLAYEIQNWLRRTKLGKSVEKRFIIEQFANFNERRKKQ